MHQKALLVARVLLGLIFLVFGLNGFLNFLPMPPMPAQAMSFVTALAQSGYFFPMHKSIETVCGALLILGLYAPLAVVMLFPITINIFVFHFFLAPDGLPLALAIIILELYLVYAFRDCYTDILSSRSDT